MQKWLRNLGMACLLFCLPTLSVAQAPPGHGAGIKNEMPKELEGIKLEPRLGNQISLGTKFRDENGAEVTLEKYFDGNKPVVMIMAYYGCPMLCGIILNAAREAFQKFEWPIGEKYRVVTISIDPREDSELAKAKKASILEAWEGEGKSGAEQEWHFLTGSKESSEKVAGELGFGYRFNAEDGQYAHGSAVFFVSPQGKLTRALFGINYSAQDLKLALLEASEGKVGNLAEKIMMFCYSYDPKANKYALLATKIMKAGGGVTVLLILITYLALYFRRRSSKAKGF